MVKSRLGQNFLIDPFYIGDLVDAAKITKDDVVLEIGAGEGVVTYELAAAAKEVYAVEIDANLIPILNDKLPMANVHIINEDALRVLSDPKKVLSLGVTKFVGSIPYQITSPLVHLIINNYQLPVTLLIQKEVAERLAAKPPRATYLSNYISNWAASVNIVKIVPKEVFNPVPEVEGAVVTLVPKSKPDIETVKFSHFLHKGFSNPRKMLNKVFEKDLLLKLGIDPTRRAETLTLEEWKKLYEAYLSI